MTVSRIGAAIDGIVALADAALASVTVLDRDGDIGAKYNDVVVVGVSSLAEMSQFVSIEDGRQEWVGLGAQSKDEFWTVQGVVASWGETQSETYKTIRDRALANAAAIETAIRSDLTLGGAFTTGRNASFAINRLTQGPTEKGRLVQVQWSVSFTARI